MSGPRSRPPVRPHGVALLLSILSILGGVPCQTATKQDKGSPTTVEERMQSWSEHLALADASPFRDLAWKSVGPRLQGGRIESIACPKDKTTVMYVGAGSGNLWKTVNNGASWTPIFENESTFAIGDVAVAPTDANIVWVGTGERLMARSSYAGTGVFKSADAGRTWQNMGLRDTHHIGRVVIDPTNADVVYVAAIGHLYSFNAQRGLFKTSDGGKTWDKCLYIDDKTGVIDVVLDPRDPRTIYATTWERDRKAWGHVEYGANSGLHKSTDGGKTWTRLADGIPTGQHVGRIGVDVAPSDPDIVYAIVDCRGDEEGVYRSADAGASFAKIGPGRGRDRIRAGYDFCLIRVAPDDPNEIFVPGQRTMHSRDGGKTWQQIQGVLIHLLEHGSKVLHLDAHALFIDPRDTDHLILGNDGGLHVSYDRGAHWLHLNNIPIGEFYDVSYDMQEPFRIFGGTQDNAALFGPSDHVPAAGVPDAWQHVYLDPWGGGDSYATLVDPTDPDTVYYEHQFGELRRKSMSTGKTQRIRPRAGDGEAPLRFNWRTPYLISHFAPKTLYCGTHRVFKSEDRGDSWTPISPDLSSRPGPDRSGNVPFGTISTLSESILEAGILYAGTDDGRVHCTRDDGGTWQRIDDDAPDSWVSCVQASRHVQGRAYVSFTGYREDDFRSLVYRVEDHGKRWTALRNNLPAESVNVIREDPTDPKILFLGTDLGCYTSIDGGTVWHSLAKSLPTTPVHDLFVHPRDATLVIGTHGRSVFTLDVEPIRKQARSARR